MATPDETTWARAKRLSAATYRQTVFQVVVALTTIGFGATAVIVNEFASNRSTLFHVAVYLLSGVVGLAMPFLCVLLFRFARAAYEQRDDVKLERDELVRQAEQLRLQSALTPDQTYRSSLVVIREDLSALRDRVTSYGQYGVWAGHTWEQRGPQGQNIVQVHVTSLARRWDDVYGALSAVYRTVEDVNRAAAAVVTYDPILHADSGPPPGPDLTTLVGELSKRIAIAEPLVEAAFKEVAQPTR